MTGFQLVSPERELSEEFAAGNLFAPQRGRQEIVGGVGIGPEALVEEAEMFLSDESEVMDLIPQFPGDGIDFVAEFFLLLGGERREFPDLLEIRSEGIREIAAADIDAGGFHGFRKILFVLGGLLHISTPDRAGYSGSTRPMPY